MGWCFNNLWFAFCFHLWVGIPLVLQPCFPSGNYFWFILQVMIVLAMICPFQKTLLKFSGVYCTVAALMFKNTIKWFLRGYFADYFLKSFACLGALFKAGKDKGRMAAVGRFIWALLCCSMVMILQILVRLYVDAYLRRLPFLTVKMQLMLETGEELQVTMPTIPNVCGLLAGSFAINFVRAVMNHTTVAE